MRREVFIEASATVLSRHLKQKVLRRHALLPSFPGSAERIEQQQSHPDTNAAIRHVECRPVISVPVDVNEINDLAEPETIKTITERTTDDETESPQPQGILRRYPHEIHEQPHQCQDGDRRKEKAQKCLALPRQHAK